MPEEYEPVPAEGYAKPETWERDLEICYTKLAGMNAGKGAYRFGFNDCMKRLGHEIDWRASEKE